MIRRVIPKIVKPLIWIAVFFIVYIAIDFCNIPTKIGIKLSAINMYIMSMVISIVIATVAFIITYYLIQQREIEKQVNQQKIAVKLIRTTMRLCETYIYDLDRPGISEMFCRINNEEDAEIKEKLSFFSKYEDNPFLYDSYISQFVINGVITDSQMQRYETAKNLYISYVTAYKICAKKEDRQDLLYQMKQETLEAICKAK